jgi:hypothetical protein
MRALAMTKIASLLTMIAAAFVCALHADPAQAQIRVFVSATGSDANTCTFAAPCRTFQHAHDTVAAGGEIDVLDPAGYGAVTISKAISIQGHGYAGIAAASGTAITINAGGSDVVSLRGLLIDGIGTGLFGVTFAGGFGLDIQDCLIRNFAGNRSAAAISVTAASGGWLLVSNTHITANNGGVSVTPAAPAGSPFHTTISNSVISGNFDGIGVAPVVGGALVMVWHSALTNNSDVAIFLTNSSDVIVTKSIITLNAVGLRSAGVGNSIISYGDNALGFNFSDGSFTATLALQ